jgi:hypothetical protein
MRIVFSVVGLLVVAAIVGLMAKKQLQAVQPVAAGTSASAGAEPAPPAQAVQRQTADDVKKALDAGMQRNSDAAAAAEAGK